MEGISSLLLVLDLVGVFFFALSGNLLAARKRFDIVGGFTLGVIAGLGGGITRDILLGGVPMSLQNPIYFLAPLAASLVVYFAGKHTERAQTSIVTFDAVGLSLFVITGTSVALRAGLPVPSAILLGVITGTGGGLIRDVVANEVPAVFEANSSLYVVPAFVGACLTALALETGVWNSVVSVAIAVLIFAFRMVSWWRNWTVPTPMRAWSFREFAAANRMRGQVWGPRRRKGAAKSGEAREAADGSGGNNADGENGGNGEDDGYDGAAER